MMGHSIAALHTHIIFSTKDRLPFIHNGIADELFHYLGGTCKALDCKPIQVGGWLDHVHIYCMLSRKIAVMDLLEEVKKRSSKWIKEQDELCHGFYWQSGYAAFSVNPKGGDALVEYITNQAKHHQHLSFQDESRMYYRKYGLEWDERYAWR